MWWTSSQETANDTLENVELNLEEYMNRQDSVGYQVYPGTESEDYDFTAERQLLHGTNLLESTVHFVKGCIGAGVLSIHVGYMYAGIWTAVAATVLMGILITYTMMILVKALHTLYVRLRIPRLSYPELAEAAVVTGSLKCIRGYGKVFRYLVEICLVAEMCGSCCIYEIMIAITAKQFFESVSTSVRDVDMSLRYYILIVAVPLIIICLIKNLKYLAPFSFLANIVIVICVFATIYFSLTVAGKISERPAWKSFDGLINFCGVCLYSLDGITVFVPVENNMRKPKYFFIVLQYGMSIVVMLLMCTGLFGYWGWGEHCISPIVAHMPAKVVPLLLQFLIVIMLNVTFAVHFWVPFRMMWYYVGRKHKRMQAFWERVYRTLLVLIITGTSVAFPNIIKIMIFMGNFFLAMNAFIFPAVIETLVTWTEHRKGRFRWALLRNAVIISLGVFFCCSALHLAINF